MRASCTLSLSLVAAGPLAAQQGSIAGQVREAGTLQPLPGVTVIIVGTRLGAITNGDGAYQIAQVPTGRYTIEARREGVAAHQKIVSVLSGGATRLDFALAGDPHLLVGIEVVGSRSDAMSRLPGSAFVLSHQDLSAQNPLSANEALRSVPGVHIQEEEGMGLRANIGVRGLDPDRSRTVLVLEDGVPVTLAPYGEPEMYYSPPIDRMDRIEIVKGSGSILFGPQTIGGVVNYVTAPPPAIPGGSVTLQGGEGSYLLGKLGYGGTWGNARGSISYFHKEAADFNGLHFGIDDVTGKVGFHAGRHDFGLKLSAYREISNSTYLGLTDSLYRASPRVHPSPDDRLDLHRYAATATHTVELTDALTLRTNAYAYTTTRDWQRRDFSYGPTGGTIVLHNTTGNRNRSFEVAGVEPRLTATLAMGGIPADLELGVRAHHETARDQHINGTAGTPYTGAIRDDEVRTGRAFAGFVQSRFYVGESVTITPGVRLEHFSYDRHILRMRVRRDTPDGVTQNPENVDIRNSDRLFEVVEGIGAAWSGSELFTVFAGVHQGFAPPRTKDAMVYQDPLLAPEDQVPQPVSLQLDAERSWNYELGARLRPTEFLGLEATAFYLDFSNQIIEPSISSGSVSQAVLANQGATLHRGVELGASLDLGRLLRQPYSLVAQGNYTWVNATFSRERRIERSPGDTVDVNGNRLPYAPEHLGNAALIMDHPAGVTLRLDGTWVGRQYSDNFETVQGSANGQTGLIPAYRVLDASAHYRLPGFTGVTLNASVKNVTGETYIASRRPQGIKVGLPRLLVVGITWGSGL